MDGVITVLHMLNTASLTLRSDQLVCILFYILRQFTVSMLYAFSLGNVESFLESYIQSVYLIL